MNLLLNKAVRNKFPNTVLPPKKKMLGDVLRISIPAALEAFLVAITGLVDTIMVSRVSKQAIAAVSITQQPYFLSLMVAMGISAGITAIIARRKGENDEEGARKTLRQSLIITTIFSLFLTVVLLLVARPFMLVTGAKKDTIDDAVIYFRVVVSALSAISLRIVICAGMRSSGETHIPLILNVIANVVNIFFNYCLIEGRLGFPRLEVLGAGIATTIGNLVAFIVAVIILIKHKSFIRISPHDDWHPDKNAMKSIAHISYGAFIEQFFMRIGFYIIAVIINNLGTNAVAVNAVISGVISLAFSLTDGFAIGASAIVGKSLGEDKKSLAFAYGRIAVLCSIVMGMIMVGTIISLRIPLSGLFSTDQEIIKETQFLLLITSFVIFPQSMQWVVTNILRGAGDIKFTAKTAIICILIIRPTLAFIFCYPLLMGVLGSWIALFIDQTTRFIINHRRVNSLKWMEIKV